MSLLKSDEILVPTEALEYIELRGGPRPLKFEVIEQFFEWLRKQDKDYVVGFLRHALSDEE